jgi:prevent-host-death family protein
VQELIFDAARALTKEMIEQRRRELPPHASFPQVIPGEGFDYVASCGYIDAMKRKTFHYLPAKVEKPVLQDAVAPEEPALVVNVRAAKDQLSSLLEVVARGDEVVITSDGRPKAKLVPVQAARRPFRMHWSWLRAQPMSTGRRAEVLVREDRDGRP